MLYLYQRTMFGKIENPKNERLLDLSHREFVTFAPLIILAVWMGLYPAPFLRRLDTSVQRVVARVSPQYATKAVAADCGAGAPGAPQVAANTGAARFLQSAPCGPDGKLPSSTPPAGSGQVAVTSSAQATSGTMGATQALSAAPGAAGKPGESR
jgi:hypothetical protein